jgi:hypothetical protein
MKTEEIPTENVTKDIFSLISKFNGFITAEKQNNIENYYFVYNGIKFLMIINKIKFDEKYTYELYSLFETIEKSLNLVSDLELKSLYNLLTVENLIK